MNSLKTTILGLMIGSTLLLAGCNGMGAMDGVNEFTKGYSSNIKSQYPAIDPSQVKVIFANQPNSQASIPCRHYETLGSVSVSTVNMLGMDRDRSSTEQDLKKAGGDFGANAVINVTQNLEDLTGYAIHCKKLA